MALTYFLKVRVTETQHKMIKKLCEVQGVSTSEWCRRTISAAARKEMGIEEGQK